MALNPQPSTALNCDMNTIPTLRSFKLLVKPHCLQLSLALTVILALSACDNRSTSPIKQVHIGITQIATHPGIDAIRKAFIDEMARLGHQ